MIPQDNIFSEDELSLDEAPSKTFYIDFEGEEIGGLIDDLDAVRQAVFCILSTERFEHLIYSWDYGAELRDLIGLDPDLALPEIERRVTEALMEDSRITDVDDFDFEVEKGVAFCSFRVVTIFGELEIEKEIEVW
ncbi:MAG: DUF2634 domain-containing protein [Oscillospiraceae bacterium]|nr:DUF2634 domain-containing protein [Oscillospiraceae bacterium]